MDPRIYQELLRAVDARVEQHMRAQPRTAYGTVAGVSGGKASVYLSGDVTASLGFIYPPHLVPVVGNRVRVVIDPRGDRYIDEAYRAGDRLRFVPIARVTVFNAATTAATIARTLTAAISGIPAEAVAVSGYLEVNGSVANASNFMVVYQTSGGTADIASIQRAGVAAVAFNQSFVAGITQSSGAKLSYEVNRVSGTITYSLFVTGYWTTL